jgi:UDP-glucose 4-epimerase
MTGSELRARGPVFVTGAAGFIGSALCRRLCADGHRVVAYDNLSRGRREYLPRGVRFVEGDIRDGRRLADAISAARPSWLIHLATMHFIPDCIARPDEAIAVNVEGTRRVLDGCLGSSVQRLIFASTAAVYAPSDRPCEEDATPLGPLEVYGESKVAGERLVTAFHADTGVPVTILRLFNAIGRNETNPHVVPHIFESLQRSDAIRLGNLESRRDYIDTRDVADAILAVPVAGLGVFNVGTGSAHSVADLIEALRRILGRPITIEQDPDRLRTTERMVLVADVDRIRRETGWAPRISLEDALEDLAVAYALRRASRASG